MRMEDHLHMEGQAVTSFMKNRIGLWRAPPASLAGMPCTVTRAGGNQIVSSFPDDITPDQPPLPFTDMAGISYMAGDVQVMIHFDGDVFEMEDQRNWTDARSRPSATVAFSISQ